MYTSFKTRVLPGPVSNLIVHFRGFLLLAVVRASKTGRSDSGARRILTRNRNQADANVLSSPRQFLRSIGIYLLLDAKSEWKQRRGIRLLLAGFELETAISTLSQIFSSN